MIVRTSRPFSFTHAAAVFAVAGGIVVTTPGAQRTPVVVPAIQASLVSHYDFDHPVAGDPTREMDLGSSGTPIALINGGAAMRVEESAYPGSGRALRTRQLNPTVNGNDDWNSALPQKYGGVSPSYNRGAFSPLWLFQPARNSVCTKS